MKRSILLFFLLPVLVAFGQPGKAGYIKSPEFESKVDQLVAEYQALDIFSGVVLVAENGNAVYHKAFGLANREKGIPNNLDTRFDIGSMNKSFTKVLILSLVNEGFLSLDDKLGEYLDGFPAEAAQNITIEHLLNHQSGYADYHTPEYWELPLKEKNLQVALEYIKNQPLIFPPGDGQEYSNAGYVLLGLIAEQATGTSYFDLVRERIINPMEMNQTYLTEKYNTPKRAIGYYKNLKGELQNNDELQEIPTPAGGFYSTTSDMLKFYRAYYYHDKLWDEETKRLDMYYPYYKEHMTTGRAISHAGGFEGANTVHYEIIRDKISVLVFANMDEIVAENLGAGILAIVRGQQPKKPALPATQNVYKAFIKKGIEFVKDNWEDLTENFHPQDPKDLILNMVGYELLFDGDIDAAIEVFKLNTQLFPGIANCWDSYGEALMKKGLDKESLKAFKKALSIRPDLPSSKAAVEKLEGKY